jgi:acetyl esterase/lipase
MKKRTLLARILALLSVGLSGLCALKIDSPAGLTLILPQALAAALAPLISVAGALGAALGLLAGAPLAVIAGVWGTLAAARHVQRVTAPHDGFERAFGPDWQHNIQPAQTKRMLKRRWTWWMPKSPEPRWERDIPYRTFSASEGQGATHLLCDVWQPPKDVRPSALAVVYVHGSAWHVGDKDLLTRPFFRHLAAQGHVVMDIAYRLSPEADIFDMVDDVQHAIAWIKAHTNEYGLDPERIVLGGGSTGGQLALLVGYTPGHPRLTPEDLKGTDTSVCAVFAHYGAADMRAVLNHAGRVLPKPAKSVNIAVSLSEAFMGDAVKGIDWRTFSAATMVGNPMGGTPEEVPEVYDLASPITHVSPSCPPTLLLQGERDVIIPAYATRELYRRLVDAGVPAVYVEFPQTNHGFDLILPQVSPSAQAATYDVDHFLGLMVQKHGG